jgi:hypothetical protein
MVGGRRRVGDFLAVLVGGEWGPISVLPLFFTEEGNQSLSQFGNLQLVICLFYLE